MNVITKLIITFVLIPFVFSCGTNIIDHGDEGKQYQTTQFPIPSPSESVDLGLSVNWAPYNVGASSPEKFGNYYAWGEIEPKEVYNAQTWCGSYNNNGNMIGSANDVAHVKWGNGWRLPSFREVRELYENCIVSKTIKNNTPGLLFKSKINGNSIFLPAAGGCADNVFVYCSEKGYYIVGNNMNLTDIDIPYFGGGVVFSGMSARAVIDSDNDIGYKISSIEYHPDNFYYERKDLIDVTAHFPFSVTFTKIPDTGNIIAQYGYIIYRNNEIYVKKSFTGQTVNTEISTTLDYLHLTDNNGVLAMSCKENWSIASYVVKMDNNEVPQLIITDCIALDLSYTEKPEIEITDFRMNNYHYDNNMNDTTINKTGELEFTVKVKGSAFTRDLELEIIESELGNNEIATERLYTNDDGYREYCWLRDGEYHFKSNIFHYLIHPYHTDKDIVRTINLKFRNQLYKPDDKNYFITSKELKLKIYKDKYEYTIE